MDRIGRNSRNFDHLVEFGFPAEQLNEARNWYLKDASTPTEQYAARDMQNGYFDDEGLVQLLVRYFNCNDWKLEGSPWFFSKQDYRQFYSTLIQPIEFHAVRLARGHGEELWGSNFLKLPFDLGMQRTKQALWQEIAHGDYYWRSQSSYMHHRAGLLFDYLCRSFETNGFSPNIFRYQWERSFRVRLNTALQAFSEELERAVRRWQDARRERTNRRFRFRQFRQGSETIHVPLQEALQMLELETNTASAEQLRKSFRRLSKRTHPDRGGSPDAFRRLIAAKDIVAEWLGMKGASATR